MRTRQIGSIHGHSVVVPVLPKTACLNGTHGNDVINDLFSIRCCLPVRIEGASGNKGRLDV